jgi:hypothetical protein
MNPRSFLITLSILLLPFLFASAAVPGNWASGDYAVGDLVIYNGTTYIASQTVTASQGAPTTATSYWSSLDVVAGSKSTPTGQPDTTPDASTLSGLNVPSDSNDTGGTDTGVASGLSTATNEQFVKQQYLDFLGREPDDGGLSYWVTDLDNGTIQRSDVVNFFVFSDEFQDKVAPVSRLYQAYFLRIPDTSGLSYWINEKLNGTSLDTISEAFAGSSEFQDRYDSLDNSAYTSLVYNNVLGRAPDQDGLDFWTNSLNAGASRGSMMTGFSESIEYKDTSLNQIRVIAFYYGMLRRAPDQAGFDFWVGVLNNGGSALDLINGFLDASEYQARF